MAEETTDANVDTESIEDQGSSPEIELQPITDDEGLASTTEFASVESKDETDKEADTETDASDDAEQNTSKDKSSEEKDFHEHSRFKELISEKNAKDEKIADLEAQIKKGEESTKTEYKIDWEKDEALIDAFTDNPKLFMSEMFQLFRAENSRLDIAKAQKDETALNEKTQRDTYEKYFTDTDGALDMWKSGDIQKYMNENPGNTPISAHKSLSESGVIQTAVDSALKKARTEWNKELKLKGRATSLSSDANPPKQVDGGEDELKNPDKYGGKKNVLVSRLKKMLA